MIVLCDFVWRTDQNSKRQIKVIIHCCSSQISCTQLANQWFYLHKFWLNMSSEYVQAQMRFGSWCSMRFSLKMNWNFSHFIIQSYFMALEDVLDKHNILWQYFYDPFCHFLSFTSPCQHIVFVKEQHDSSKIHFVLHRIILVFEQSEQTKTEFYRWTVPLNVKLTKAHLFRDLKG